MATASANQSNLSEQKLQTATQLGKPYGLSAVKINRILADLGWMKKMDGDWKLTPFGEGIGGREIKAKTGQLYIKWPDKIIQITSLKEKLPDLDGDEVKEKQADYTAEFRGKFKADYWSADGHNVRSRAEALIDDWLYNNRIVHAYEMRVPIEEELYTDFYLPEHKIYIEYWGLESRNDYQDRKKKKLALYQKYNISLVELEDSDINNIHDVLPKRLSSLGVNCI